ncbi:hypothetical protein BOX15_Mlig014026g1 [Macrostomum lignano]|uniref:FAD-dependent oxidoreductase n=2 Tax=Macrostomum lignano TaxID=282301 RepID=A0A1I8I2B6_9PLAT|nr:hypothetical protein BOX15_Mlig014026g1 [Macrostomum lignano]
MSEYYSSFQETGLTLLVDRQRIGQSDAFHLNAASIAAAAAAAAVAGKNAATAALHSGDWPEQARKSCINRLHGNGSWVRYCACEDCQRVHAVRFRRSSNGSSNGDVQLVDDEPTLVADENLRMTYEVWGLRQNELPVKGTYVDPKILPGFKYRVRCLGPGGRSVFPEPRRLLSIGAGYGKRLTFDVKSLSSGEGANRRPVDHFWSDSWPEGYALSLSALDVGQRFALQTRSGQEIGRAEVTWTVPEPAECRLRLGADFVVASVPVAFRASVGLTACRCLLGCHDYEDVAMTGIARLERPAGSRAVATVARVDGVRLPSLPDLRLVPID